MLTTSAAFLDQKDYRSAALIARQALATQPDDPAAVGLLAEIATRAGSPEALLWLQRLTELLPGEPAAQFALIRAAIAGHEFTVAEQAIARLTPAQLQTTAAQSLAGSLAIFQKNWPLAEQHFTEAARLDPTAIEPALNLAAIRLRDTRSPQAEAARAELQRLRSQPAARLIALRTLLADARARKDTAAAMALATELNDSPAASADDRLRLLEELQQRADPAFTTALEADLSAAGEDPAKLAPLTRWMNAHGLSARAAACLDALPERYRNLPALLLNRTESAAAAGDWKLVAKLTADDGPDWQVLDFLRLVFATRAYVENAGGKRGSDFATRWERTVNSTAGNSASLTILAGTVQAWGWRDEATGLWWLLARRPVGARPALERLWQLAAEKKDTAALLRITRRITDIEPANVAAQNNLAYFLLLRGEDLPRAHALAAANLAKHPDSPGLRATSMLSLSLQARHPEACALLALLPAEMLRAPAISASAGAVLAAAGRREEARAFLAAASAAADLLPEERALVAHALAP